MRTVTLVAHDRPSHTAKAICALTDAILKSDEQIFDTLILSIDPGCQEVTDVCDKAAEMLSNAGVINCALYVNKEKFGVSGNTLVALSRAFEEHGSDFNLSIEDDAILTPDAALLAQWFDDKYGGEESTYTLFSMCNHRAFGRGENPGNIANDPAYLVESLLITSPFAWCLPACHWPFVQDSWDRKTLPPNGWDFSLSFSMRLAKRRALHPILSRCQNIGKTGVHSNPEDFKRTEEGIIHSDGSYAGPYKIVGRVPDSEFNVVDDWMVAELQRIKEESNEEHKSGS